MKQVFEISPIDPSFTWLDIVVVLFMLVATWGMYKTKAPKLLLFGFLALSLIYVTSTLHGMNYHYSSYKEYVNSSHKVELVEGSVLEKRLNPAGAGWLFEIGSRKFVYIDRGGSGCQGEEGWLNRVIDVGDYVELKYVQTDPNPEIVRCLAQLKIRVKS
ncbi:hypothetical protein ACMZOO_07950 [Catenovulum sp. SX2]|uniref:hypothetical protein n=1 Tax=Catenovulum sp. SX2 TaxID=3398614 RepID=UPI003F85DA2F